MNKGDKKAEEVEPGTDLNPTKATPAFIKTLSKGSLTILENDPLFKKFKIGDNVFVMEREDIGNDVWIIYKTKSSPEKTE